MKKMTNSSLIRLNDETGNLSDNYIGKGASFNVYEDGRVTVETPVGEKRVDTLGVIPGILDPVVVKG